MTTIQARVQAGAAWLDENRPGWIDRIDLATLDLGDPCRCVLGQEYGDWDEAPDALTEQPESSDLGFDRDSFGYSPSWPENRRRSAVLYVELTAAWRDYITARRAAA